MVVQDYRESLRNNPIPSGMIDAARKNTRTGFPVIKLMILVPTPRTEVNAARVVSIGGIGVGVMTVHAPFDIISQADYRLMILSALFKVHYRTFWIAVDFIGAKTLDVFCNRRFLVDECGDLLETLSCIVAGDKDCQNDEK